MAHDKSAPAVEPCLRIIGGGVAGCAAAWAAARSGLRVHLSLDGDRLGGVAAAGDHRTLCGLAAIDAPQPTLLEAQWTAPFIDAVANGPAFRRGRVWLWPTDGSCLQRGLGQLLKAQGVHCHFNQRISSLVVDARQSRIRALRLADGSELSATACIDASGGPDLGLSLGLGQRPAAQWAALRGQVMVDQAFITAWQGAGRQRLLRQLYAALPEHSQRPAISVEIIAAQCIQFGMDLSHNISFQEGLALWQAVVHKLGYTVQRAPQEIAARDAGGIAGGLTLDALFSQEQRGLCWLAWPYEWHDGKGVQWRWPDQGKYGFPLAALQPTTDIVNYWSIGKGMAVSSEAMAALRVTGSAWHIGAACGEWVAQHLRG